MVKALIDTNILIDHLNALPGARDELARYDDKAISIITWMEVMVGAEPVLAVDTQRFLDGFALIDIDKPVAEKAVALRRDHKIKLPDAIIWASAQVDNRLLVTRNTKDFPAADPGIRMPYTLKGRT